MEAGSPCFALESVKALTYMFVLQDLNVNLGQLTFHLKKFCDLKTVKDMVEERADQQAGCGRLGEDSG